MPRRVIRSTGPGADSGGPRPPRLWWSWPGTGTRIEGRINPGRNTSNFTAATLDASQWGVHIEAVTREGQSIVIDGTLADLGSYHRTLTGTWTVDGTAYPLTLTRE